MSNWYQRFWLIVFGTISFFSSAHADKWSLPDVQEYYSSDHQYRLRVIPADFENDLALLDTAPTLALLQTIANLNLDPKKCRGLFEKRMTGGNGQYELVWKRELVNRESAVEAVVSSNGEYVATFDNWHEAGYGPHAIVIYNARGDRIRSLGLLDFLQPDEFAKLGVSVSSIWWFDSATFSNSILTIKVIQHEASSNEPRLLQIKIDAKSGNVVRDHATTKAIQGRKLRCHGFKLWAKYGFMSGTFNPFTIGAPWFWWEVCDSMYNDK